MFDLDRWREIFQSISKNKLRSALSGFTVAFAILLFTLLFGIGNGLQNTFKNEFAKDAMNSIYIWSNNTTIAYKGNQIGRRIQFKNDDFTYIKENFGDKIQTISPRIQRSENVVYKDEKDNYTIRGVYPEYYVLESAEVTEGRFLNYRDSVILDNDMLFLNKVDFKNIIKNNNKVHMFHNYEKIGGWSVNDIFKDEYKANINFHGGTWYIPADIDMKTHFNDYINFIEVLQQKNPDFTIIFTKIFVYLIVIRNSIIE